MKNILKTLTLFAAASTGVGLGSWLWEEVLKGEANNLKSRLNKKKGS